MKFLGIPAFEAYYGVSGSTHQSNFNRLVAKGYCVITLSVYGVPTNRLYAAVWVQGGGPAWDAIHGFTAGQHQAKFTQMSAAHSLGHRNTKQRGVCRNFRAEDGHRVANKIWLNRRSRHLF